MTAFISPFISDRELVRNLFPKGQFLEVFVDSSLEVCEKRDPKGMYKKARNGEIANFTGISSPYEKPIKPEMYIDNNDDASLDALSNKIIDYLVENKYLVEREG